MKAPTDLPDFGVSMLLLVRDAKGRGKSQGIDYICVRWVREIHRFWHNENAYKEEEGSQS
jgi:hypothetical protein